MKTIEMEESAFKYSSVISVGVIILLFICFVYPVLRPEIYLYSAFTDDFYYYLKIALNFTEGFGFSYTRGIQTNGYQPLHQYLIVALQYIAKTFGWNVLVFIRIVFSLLFLFASFSLYKRINPGNLTSNLLFALAVVSYFFISYSGMESLLIVPVITHLFLDIKNQDTNILRIAFLFLLSFFIRIDSIVFIIPLGLYYLYVQRLFLRTRLKDLVVSSLVIIFPISVYLTINSLVYGSAFPVSGLAKTVVRFSGVHPYAIQSYLFYKPYNLFNIAILVICITTLLFAKIRNRVFFGLLVISIMLFYLQTSVRSDWGLWAWYFYPMPVIAFLLAAEFKYLESRQRVVAFLSNLIAMITVISLVALLILYTFPLPFLGAAKTGRKDILHEAGFKIKEFEQSHPGIYAMGDKAGIVGYLIKSPLIQLEGLVMDRQYLAQLANTKRLIDLLSKYDVNYYISSNPQRLADGRYRVIEPLQSHGYSKRITDTVNWKVVNQFTLYGRSMATGKVNEVTETVIFEVPTARTGWHSDATMKKRTASMR